LFRATIYAGQPLIERKKALRWVLRKSGDGIQYVEQTEGDGAEMFKAVCKLGLEVVSKKLDAPTSRERQRRG
jgi:ATP-dependent DNA ligase